MHYFLFLEPNTARSKTAYGMLQQNFGANVKKDEKKENTINIKLMVDEKDSDGFGAAELMVGLLKASKHNDDNIDKSESELFIKNTDSFFTILGSWIMKENKTFGENFTFPFFTKLQRQNIWKHIVCTYAQELMRPPPYGWKKIMTN